MRKSETHRSAGEAENRNKVNKPTYSMLTYLARKY